MFKNGYAFALGLHIQVCSFDSILLVCNPDSKVSLDLFMNACLLALWLQKRSIRFTFDHFFLNGPELSVKGGLPAHLQLEGIFLGKDETSFGLFLIRFGIFAHFLQELFKFIALAFAFVIIEALGGNVVVSGVEKVVDLVVLIVVQVGLLRKSRVREDISPFVVIQRFIEILEDGVDGVTDLLVAVDEVEEVVDILESFEGDGSKILVEKLVVVAERVQQLEAYLLLGALQQGLELHPRVTFICHPGNRNGNYRIQCSNSKHPCLN